MARAKGYTYSWLCQLSENDTGRGYWLFEQWNSPGEGQEGPYNPVCLLWKENENRILLANETRMKHAVLSSMDDSPSNGTISMKSKLLPKPQSIQIEKRREKIQDFFPMGIRWIIQHCKQVWRFNLLHMHDKGIKCHAARQETLQCFEQTQKNQLTAWDLHIVWSLF